MPRVSVIIATYNQSGYIAQAIHSALGQTFTDLEVIVIDDGSTDDTRQRVASIQDPRVRYFYQENSERSAARNAGIGLASGEYVCFLDSDDFYLPGKLLSQVKALDENPAYDVVYSDVVLCNAEGITLRVVESEHTSGDVWPNLVRRNWIVLSSPLLRRRCLTKDAVFDVDLSSFEDWDLWLRIAQTALFLHVPGTVACYRVHQGMTSRDRQRMWRGALAVRRRLTDSVRFHSLSQADRQYERYQRGLLECLVGDLAIGRRELMAAVVGQPRILTAMAAWVLSLLGRQALQAAMSLRTDRRDWLRSRMGDSGGFL